MTVNSQQSIFTRASKMYTRKGPDRSRNRLQSKFRPICNTSKRRVQRPDWVYRAELRFSGYGSSSLEKSKFRFNAHWWGGGAEKRLKTSTGGLSLPRPSYVDNQTVMSSKKTGPCESRGNVLKSKTFAGHSQPYGFDGSCRSFVRSARVAFCLFFYIVVDSVKVVPRVSRRRRRHKNDVLGTETRLFTANTVAIT